MSELVERVAKAIRAGRSCLDDAPCAFCEHKPDGCMALARAAIEAMREPTDKMIVEAMIQPYPSVAEAGGVLEQGRAAVRIEWQAMIDEALK